MPKNENLAKNVEKLRKQKELIAKVNEARKKARENFLQEVTTYLENARAAVKFPKNKRS